MRFFILVFFTLLSGCQLLNEIKRDEELASPKGIEGSVPMEVKSMSSLPLHQYTLQLANQLYKGEAGRLRNAHIAVMSFTMATDLGQETAMQQNAGLSQQIQESLITQMTQYGYGVVEHR